ncbi:MAG: hypothetical protein QW587_01815 [Candidatus Bathyarchaeia archaeon]
MSSIDALPPIDGLLPLRVLGGSRGSTSPPLTITQLQELHT